LLTVIVMYRAVHYLSDGDVTIALLGSLIVPSAPAFVRYGGFYGVESIQTLAVAWFIFIMAHASAWTAAYASSHLLTASAFDYQKYSQFKVIF